MTTTPAVGGSGFRGVGFNCESNVEVTVRCARGGESPSGESPSDESCVGGELRFDAKVARDAARVARAAIRASSSTPRASSSSSDAVDTIRSVECAVSNARGVEGVGFEWRREWRARDVVRGDRDDDSYTTTGATQPSAVTPRRRGRGGFQVRVRPGHRDRPARRRSERVLRV